MRSLQSLMMRCINDAHLLSPRGFNNSGRGAASAFASVSVSTSVSAASVDWLWWAQCGGRGRVLRETCLPATKWQAFVCLFQRGDTSRGGSYEEMREVLSADEQAKVASIVFDMKIAQSKILETSACCRCCCCCLLIEFLRSHTCRHAHAHTHAQSLVLVGTRATTTNLVYYEAYFFFMARCVEPRSMAKLVRTRGPQIVWHTIKWTGTNFTR